jgi:hypothetical protein
MGGEIVQMVVVAFACAAIGYGALHFAAKLPTARLGSKSEWRNRIMPECRELLLAGDQSDYFKMGHCMGLVEGLALGVGRQSNALKVTPPFCVPPTATIGQMVRVVVQYIDQRPERSSESSLAL